MGKSILITGGARSGKSQIAETITLHLGRPAVYIATAQAFDTEMEDRIARHQARRGPEWHTLHAPHDLVTALTDSDGTGPRLVDCLTLWLSNLMLDNADWRAATETLAASLSHQHTPVVFVTNEVGSGIVPETRLGRQFRDAQGDVNQIISTACDAVYLAVSGYPLKVKPNDILSQL
ncbi:MAG: bifunctional adenosylcobinamide kinase/adenosylcobinamide-phosphate guanylyltransferase [Paracoccaceae bacterium]